MKDSNEVRLAALESKIASLKERQYPLAIRLLKDFAPLITGVLISALGLYATMKHNERQAKRQELNSLQEVIPLLSSADPFKREFGYQLFARFGERELLVSIFKAQDDNVGIRALSETGQVSEEVVLEGDKRFAKQLGSDKIEPDQTIDGEWVYLGHFDSEKNKWITQYFDFNLNSTPESIKGQEIKVLKKVGTANIRKSPPTKTGSLGISIGISKASDDPLSVSHTLNWSGTGYIWAKITR